MVDQQVLQNGLFRLCACQVTVRVKKTQGEMLIWPCQQPPGWMSLAPQSTGSPSLSTEDKLANFSHAGHSNLCSRSRQIGSAKRVTLREGRPEISG
ncbi:unnamed protein product [Pleuronectes platessa]|uniref:Uncharacterized protein n=1 Tax=Pleuronectes platessa TaxID=8262 RepID=A0A9N7VDB4_PLEPL|nr:unnamed protein product [Pleuronectes platessa]